MNLFKLNRDVFNTVRQLGLFKGEIKNIIQRKNEWKNTVLTLDQQSQAKDFIRKNYGKAVPLWWHRLYTSYTGVFDKRYFPEILFSSKLEDKLNPYEEASALGNKAFNPNILFGGLLTESKIRAPECFCFSCYGTIWNSNGEIVDNTWVVNNIYKGREYIIKPTIDSMGAKNVRLIKIVDGVDSISNESFENVLNAYHGNYIIQERVRNHESIAAVYPHSINTCRVITFICDNDIHVAPLTMRFGVQGRIVDNAGIFIGVTKDGFLKETGFSKKGIVRFTKHPDTHVLFNGYHICGVDAMVNAAVKLHTRLPQLKMISWDLAYDENENVVIIEVNTIGQSIWFPQMVNGESIFGEYTEKMYTLIR